MIRKPKRNIVDLVLDLMDEGPRPMKNMKVTKKNRNCVDQFWDAHQAEYEARGKQSRDDLEKVNQHNLTYPRLGDELNRRKSFSKVKTNLQRIDFSNRTYDTACAACMKLRRCSQLQKNNVKSKQRKIKIKTRPRDIKSRVGKNRYRTTKINKSRLPKTISVNKMKKCHCCYVSVKNKRVGNDVSSNLDLESENTKQSVHTLNERMSSSSKIQNVPPKERRSSSSKEQNIQPKEQTNCSEPGNLLSSERMNDLKNEEEGSGKTSIKSFKNPDTSVASISSYNSYASMDHEPMVNMEL